MPSTRIQLLWCLRGVGDTLTMNGSLDSKVGVEKIVRKREKGGGSRTCHNISQVCVTFLCLE